MSVQYDDYLKQHRGNVQKGLLWFEEHLPYIQILEGVNHDTLLRAANEHDRSKDDPEEYCAYDDYFYGGNRTHLVVNNFNRAWLRHIHLNPHHWQHWILVRDEPNEGTKALDMPPIYIVEMICDWWAFSWKSGNLYEIFEWWDKHKEYMILSPRTRNTVKAILDALKDTLDELKEANNGKAETA